MRGFFDWDWEALAENDAPSVCCPNCGSRVYRNGMTMPRAVERHECSNAAVESHHVARLDEQFVVCGEGKFNFWVPFGAWLDTPEGVFEQRYAETNR